MNLDRPTHIVPVRARGLGTLDYFVAFGVLSLATAVLADYTDHLRLAVAYIQHWLT